MTLLPLLFAALLAPSGNEQEARLHFREAEKLYARGFYEDALSSYKSAYRAKPLPGFLFNIGQCYRNLGEYSQAVTFFRRYLELKPNASNRDAVEALIRELEKKQPPQAQTLPPQPPPLVPARPPPVVTKPKLEPPPPKRVLAPVDPNLVPEAQVTTTETPYYKKWWFWTLTGVVAAGAGVGIYFATRSSTDGTLPGITYP